MVRLISASLLAAVAVFLFGWIYWSGPLASAGINEVADDVVAQALLGETFPDSGVYFVPGMSLYREDPDRYAELHTAGPVAIVNIVHDAGSPMEPSIFVWGFLHYLVTCLLIGLLLQRVAPALPSYGARVGFVVLAGVAMAFFAEMAEAIWWREPLSRQLVAAGYDVGAWLVAGLVLAKWALPSASETAA
jgi:hypothetical protein